LPDDDVEIGFSHYHSLLAAPCQRSSQGCMIIALPRSAEMSNIAARFRRGSHSTGLAIRGIKQERSCAISQTACAKSPRLQPP
jgi:hypothetical protein